MSNAAPALLDDDAPVFGSNSGGAAGGPLLQPRNRAGAGPSEHNPRSNTTVIPAARRSEGGAASKGLENHGETKPKSLWVRYLEANKKRPLATKMITTGVLSAIGNAAGQFIVISKGKQPKFSFKKLTAFVLFGSFLSGPMGHMWLKFLNGRKTGLQGQKLVLYKISMDRLLYGPCFNVIQMAFVYKVSGQNLKQVLKSMQATFLNAQIMNFKMWPFAQYINFNFVPPELQLLYMNFVALIWTITLTSIMN